VVFASPNCLRVLGTVVSAHRRAVRGWVAALVTPRLASGLATGCFTGEDVG